MADQKITDLTEATTLAGSDIVPVVTNPGGSPENKKITVDNLKTQFSQLSSSTYLYFGDPTTNGTIRMGVSGGSLVIEKRVAGNYVEIGEFSE